MPKGYTTELQIENFLNVSIPSGDADFYIEAAEAFIDDYTDRNFVATDPATERVFDGQGGDLLNIDECIEVTVVKQGLDEYGDSTLTISAGGSNGYYLLPNNYDEKNIPIDKIHLRDKVWYRGLQNHKVTAKWGYSASAPNAIEMAATILAAGYYHFNRGGASGNVASEKIGNYAVSYPNKDPKDMYNRIMELLSVYRRITL